MPINDPLNEEKLLIQHYNDFRNTCGNVSISSLLLRTSCVNQPNSCSSYQPPISSLTLEITKKKMYDRNI